MHASSLAVVLALGGTVPLSAQQAGVARPNATSPASSVTTAPNETYDAVLEGMACKQQKTGQMDCEYRVGRALRFVIAGVGQEDVAVNFFEVDPAADYYAGVVLLHGCVVVKPLRPADAARVSAPRSDSVATFAFVSPRNGKVFRTWPMCLSATKPDGVKAQQPSAGQGAATKVVPPPVKPPRA